MADLNPLIRVRTHIVEQKQKILADLYAEIDALEAEKVDILKKLEEEGEKILKENTGEMQGYYGNYAKSVRMRIAQIDKDIVKLERRTEVAADDMKAAFADLKKVEITQQERETEERATQDKKESDQLDEIALDGYRRKIGGEQG